jgi:D-tyrosyl-tRNA(Tyr) deacylase
MRVIIQRVTEASVTVEQKIVGKIGKGLLVLVGFTSGDSFKEIDHVSNKILKLKLWSNQNDVRWAEGVMDQNLEVLCVSQFTLYTTLKGNKPDFHLAMEPESANKIYELFLDCLRKKYKPEKIQSGVFGGYMSVALVNDGPVTIDLEYPEKKEFENNDCQPIVSNEKYEEKKGGNKKEKPKKEKNKKINPKNIESSIENLTKIKEEIKEFEQAIEELKDKVKFEPNDNSINKNI